MSILYLGLAPYSNRQFCDRRKTTQMQTNGTPSLKASISSLWGPKQLESLLELDLRLGVTPEKAVLRRKGVSEGSS